MGLVEWIQVPRAAAFLDTRFLLLRTWYSFFYGRSQINDDILPERYAITIGIKKYARDVIRVGLVRWLADLVTTPRSRPPNPPPPVRILIRYERFLKPPPPPTNHTLPPAIQVIRYLPLLLTVTITSYLLWLAKSCIYVSGTLMLFVERMRICPEGNVIVVWEVFIFFAIVLFFEHNLVFFVFHIYFLWFALFNSFIGNAKEDI